MLSQPAFRLELLAVVEVVLAGAQSMAVYHQHRLQEQSEHMMHLIHIAVYLKRTDTFDTCRLMYVLFHHSSCSH